MPQLFLSGAFFPLESFPAFLQPIAKIMPMTFLNDSFKMVAFEGVSIVETLPKLGGLLLWGVGIYLIVLFTFKWE
jgi:ABC-2 type transport system permease protein